MFSISINMCTKTRRNDKKEVQCCRRSHNINHFAVTLIPYIARVIFEEREKEKEKVKKSRKNRQKLCFRCRVKEGVHPKYSSFSSSICFFFFHCLIFSS